jgi:hypothetical protein
VTIEVANQICPKYTITYVRWHVFLHRAGCNDLVFGCCQPDSMLATCVFVYLRADIELGSHDA